MTSKKPKPPAAKKPKSPAAKKPKPAAAQSSLPAPKFEFVGDLQDLSVSALTSVAGGVWKPNCASSACGGTPGKPNTCGGSGNCYSSLKISSLDSGEGSLWDGQSLYTASGLGPEGDFRLQDDGTGIGAQQTAQQTALIDRDLIPRELDGNLDIGAQQTALSDRDLIPGERDDGNLGIGTQQTALLVAGDLEGDLEGDLIPRELDGNLGNGLQKTALVGDLIPSDDEGSLV